MWSSVNPLTAVAHAIGAMPFHYAVNYCNDPELPRPCWYVHMQIYGDEPLQLMIDRVEQLGYSVTRTANHRLIIIWKAQNDFA